MVSGGHRYVPPVGSKPSVQVSCVAGTISAIPKKLMSILATISKVFYKTAIQQHNMKKQLLAAAIALTASAAPAFAQTTVIDTVSVGATTGGISYPNQVWYSLPNDEQGSRDRTEWDIAFDLKSTISGVITNSPSGVTLWKYPKGDLATGWATIDTAGLSTWKAHYNSDTSWALGAIGAYADPNNAANLDWGNYNTTTHIITGDSLYIIKLANGHYLKFAIESLVGGVYNFKYANLDGTGAQTNSITKSSYTDKNFAYYNLTTNTILDREPAAAAWELLFTQYTTFIPSAYTVTGVLLNRGVKAVKVSNLPDVDTNTNYSGQTFSSQINTIGYNWKSFTGMTYAVKDSQLYFVRSTNGDIWKVIFKGFGGAANGNFIFSKEKIYTQPAPPLPNGIATVNGNALPVLAITTNPATSAAYVVCDFGNNAADASLSVYDLAGRRVSGMQLTRPVGLQQYALPVSTLPGGNYIVVLQTAGGRVTQKLTIQ